MAGTNVGAVYLDLRLNVKELTRGFSDVEKRVGGLEGVFGRLQDAGMYSMKGRYDVYPIFVGRISVCGTKA